MPDRIITQAEYDEILAKLTGINKRKKRIKEIIEGADPYPEFPPFPDVVPLPEPEPEPAPPQHAANVFGANVGVRTVDVAGQEVWHYWHGNAGYANGKVDQALDWGFPMVRFNLATQSFPHNGSTFEKEGSLRGMLEGIMEYTAAGIEVMLVAQNAGDTGVTNPVDSERWNDLVQWWDMAIAGINTLPSITRERVLINWANETHADTPGWVNYNTTVRDTLRNLGWQGRIVVDLPGWGQDIQWLLQGGNVVPGVIYGWHAYGAIRRPGETWASGDMGYAEMWPLMEDIFREIEWQNLPVIIGEFGASNDGSSNYNYTREDAAARCVLELAPEFGVRALWWHGTWWDSYSLTADRHHSFHTVDPVAPLSPLGETLFLKNNS